jgi:glutamate dehydrogenase/leucine dehydrogenase
MSPYAFAELLAGLGIRRAYFVLKDGQLQASHAELAAFADSIRENRRDFDAHEAVFLAIGEHTGALHAAFIHKAVRGQAAGGVRHWQYATLSELIADGLRLARGMGRKNALAGLWWGGGKGIIAQNPSRSLTDNQYRAALYEEYGRFITSLRGYYVTAEDVGTQADDMAAVFRTTRHVTCIPPECGGSGNPSFATARGVVCAMQAALDFTGKASIAGKRIVVQGLGNVASAMIRNLIEQGVGSVVASDISPHKVEAARARYAGAPVEIRLLAPNDTTLFREPCDVFAPCALGGVLNPETVPLLNAPIVCGAANNQLLDDTRDDALLAQRGISYVPDFVANRMGIVNCANEQYGVLPKDPAVLRHFDAAWHDSVFAITQRVFERARAQGVTTTRAANDLADELALEPHPLWPGRGQQILAALLDEDWARKSRS